VECGGVGLVCDLELQVRYGVRPYKELEGVHGLACNGDKQADVSAPDFGRAGGPVCRILDTNFG
jgi:hypothetical protein